MTTSEQSSKKIVAGILGILLGTFGVHKFYLGMTQSAVIMLAVSLLGIFLSFLFVPILATWAMGIIGLIEGILYLTKSDAEFTRTYEIGKKPWF